MKKLRKIVRRSISLASDTDDQVRKLAQRQRQSTSRVLEELVQAGLAAKEAEKQQFFDLAERLRTTNNAEELRQIKDALARMTFGS